MGSTIYHTVFGFCWWDIPALLILAGLALFFILRHRSLKKREKELEDKLSEIYTDNTMEPQEDGGSL